jgi:hypothetical protein
MVSASLTDTNNGLPADTQGPFSYSGVLNFALSYDLILMNSLFKKRVSHLVTFSDSQHCNQTVGSKHTYRQSRGMNDWGSQI